MALAALSEDEQRIVFLQLCNALAPCVAVNFISASSGLRASTLALRQQLRADNEVATALCHKVWRMASCKKLREAMEVHWIYPKLTGAELATLGKLGSVLPALEALTLLEGSVAAVPEGMQWLAEELGAGALPAMNSLVLSRVHVGNAGAPALAAALGRGALPRLKVLQLANAALSDAGLVALAPALRRLPALETLDLKCNPFGDDGLAALVAPPSPASAPPPTGVLTKLKKLDLFCTQVTDAGCATLASALDSGRLPALEMIELFGIPASAAATNKALAKAKAAVSLRAILAAVHRTRQNTDLAAALALG